MSVFRRFLQGLTCEGQATFRQIVIVDVYCVLVQMLKGVLAWYWRHDVQDSTDKSWKKRGTVTSILPFFAFKKTSAKAIQFLLLVVVVVVPVVLVLVVVVVVVVAAAAAAVVVVVVVTCCYLLLLVVVTCCCYLFLLLVLVLVLALVVFQSPSSFSGGVSYFLWRGVKQLPLFPI